MFFSVAIKYSLVSFIQFAIKKLNFFFVGLFCLLTPVKKNKIVFSSFEGAWLGCNPKYILKELL
ncbi:hypothetical protein IJ425_03125, partial [bacterium]|nr:hypothetical protein [bacterium]